MRRPANVSCCVIATIQKSWLGKLSPVRLPDTL
jgi:hypothetical protein